VTERTLYERQESPGGRVRYVPVSERVEYDSLGFGTWLIQVKPGCKSTTRLIYPEYAEVEDAMKVAADAMSEAMVRAAEHKPDVSSYSRAEAEIIRECYYQLAKIGSCRGIVGTIPAAREIVEAGISVLREEMMKG
jgi:hypothetical protein